MDYSLIVRILLEQCTYNRLTFCKEMKMSWGRLLH